MKLYTEKQVLRMMELARFSYASEDKILFSFTPFVLPTEEEIKDRSIGHSDYHAHQASFSYGAKYVIDKMKGGNK